MDQNHRNEHSSKHYPVQRSVQQDNFNSASRNKQHVQKGPDLPGNQHQNHSEPSKHKKNPFRRSESKRQQKKNQAPVTTVPSAAFHGKSVPHNPKRKGPLARLTIMWWNRIMGGSWSSQESVYPSKRAGRDYVWNTIGFSAWGAVFPLLTIVATQLVGVEQAGMFSLAFVTASLLMILGNYGVRVYQVSDLQEEHSFADYQIQRVITCILMLLAGYLYCRFRSYESLMMTISMGVYAYRMIDALADVYEGRLQQKDKLYLAGVSQTIRSVGVLIVSSVVLLISRDLGMASIAMAIIALISFLFVTLPLALIETSRSEHLSFAGITDLFKQCFPLFISLFLYALVDNMPKFAMEGVLAYDAQLYFNALYFPAQSILLTVGFIYKPLLVRMAAAWANVKQRRKFDLFIGAMMLIIVAITLVNIFFMGWIGIPIMNFLYGVDFEQYRDLSYIMLAAGGVTGAIDFLYQVITILRRQKVVPKLYAITFGFSLLVLLLLINITGLPGAVVGYLIVMTILLVLLVWEYVSVRLEYARHPEEDASLAKAE